MLGDVLLIEEKHYRVGELVVQKILDGRKDRFICAVSGESGSGKSELCHVFARLLAKHGIIAKVVSADNFYKIDPLDRSAWRQKHGIEKSVGLSEYDWDAINRMISAFRAKEKATIPCIDLVTNHIDSLTTDFGKVDMLMIDGLYSIKADPVDLKVFIELTYHETKKAQVIRGKEPQNELRMSILEQEHRGVQSLRPLADLLITKSYEVLDGPTALEENALGLEIDCSLAVAAEAV